MEQSYENIMINRMTTGSPSKPYESSDDLNQREATPSTQNSMLASSNINCVLDGEVMPFMRQKPEKAGETASDQISRTDSRDCNTLTGDEERESEEYANQSIPEADEYGFFLNTDSSVPSARAFVDVKVLRRREMKWIEMFENWTFYMDHKFDKVRERCRKGIPPSLRGKAWKYLCGAVYHMDYSKNKEVFDICVNKEVDPKWADDIEKDLNRQFPEHEMFATTGTYGKNGRDDLSTLLKTWTVLFPEEGYCQGQAPIASVLLMHMPLKDAFYCFVQVCTRYLPKYYSPGLEAVQVDGDVLVQLLKEKSSVSYRHLKKNNVDPVLYMIEWFMCVFCRTLPWPTVLRVWDMFFCEGVKVLFKVALVLFKFGLGTKEQCKQFPDLHSIVTRLRHLPPHIMTEEFLVKKVCEINLDESQMERLHMRAMKLRQMKAKEDS
ncbi:unnamed protein product [Auanema sp. JU1783]|nr:unnamed protein product [Auanema sp. JU1783]